jgi:hypothetical protein
MKIPAPSAASSTVVPAGTVTSWPLMVSVTVDKGVTSFLKVYRLKAEDGRLILKSKTLV